MSRLLVCGGRSYDPTLVVRWLKEYSNGGTIEAIINGGASGADAGARLFAKETGVECLTYPADWGNLGKAAGPVRNVYMLRHGKPDVVIAFPGHRGTEDMKRRARHLGVPIIEADGANPP